ncbi:hypothetical protein Vafri_1375 [Volvox africanus]|nr:hypothetical protein Vafri_1375 [Volvox africanus]
MPGHITDSTGPPSHTFSTDLRHAAPTRHSHEPQSSLNPAAARTVFLWRTNLPQKSCQQRCGVLRCVLLKQPPPQQPPPTTTKSVHTAAGRQPGILRTLRFAFGLWPRHFQLSPVWLLRHKLPFNTRAPPSVLVPLIYSRSETTCTAQLIGKIGGGHIAIALTHRSGDAGHGLQLLI